jgi:hypothetical protein
MLEIILAPHAKSDPARVGNPVVLLSQTFCQKRIAYWVRERNIYNPASMDVPNFCVSESEFPPPKTMWMRRHLRQRREFFFNLLQKVHYCQLQGLGLSMPENARSIQQDALRLSIQAKMSFDYLAR